MNMELKQNILQKIKDYHSGLNYVYNIYKDHYVFKENKTLKK